MVFFNLMDFFFIYFILGIISREEAEKLLFGKKCGAFLVRVTERIFGYAVSYRTVEGLKNFLVERISEGYQFMGLCHFFIFLIKN